MTNRSTEGNFANTLLGAVDWKGIPQQDINQIKYEVENWYSDYCELQKCRELLGKDIGEPFECKFDRWIVDRIEMVLDRQ